MKKSVRIFISYSWTSPKHEEWVLHLAEELQSNGVEVILDKWDLKEGQDKYYFMENSVKSDDTDKVLLILDKAYAEKANNRKGGVGTETQIISQDIYEDVKQEKFIPIVCERSEDGIKFLPHFLKSRMYIDMSDDTVYFQNFEKLLRNLFDRPIYKKPQLGEAPDYLFEDDPKSTRYRTIRKKLAQAIEQNPDRVNGILKEFCNEFFKNLYNDYKMEVGASDWVTAGQEIVENLSAQLPLRDEFILFFDELLKNESEFDIDVLIRFFERLPSLTEFRENQTSSKSHEYDNYKFIIHEMFLSLIALCLKHERYKLIGDIFHTRYFIESKYSKNQEGSTFNAFYNHIDSLNQYFKQVKGKDFYSPTAQLMMDRMSPKLSKDYFIYADLICHYVSSLEGKDPFAWFPITYIYQTSGKFRFFDRFISKRYFEKVKFIFDVDSPEQLREKISVLIEKNTSPTGYNLARNMAKPLNEMINLDLLASER